MHKKEQHLSDLREFDVSDKALEIYLLENSNLPGKRANIELAFAFADYFEELYGKTEKDLFELCRSLYSKYNPRNSKTGREEFAGFCAVIALGRLGRIDAKEKDEVIDLMKSFAGDERWRIREAVAMAVQELMETDPMETLDMVVQWLDENSYLIDRALAAGVANPQLMKNEMIAGRALAIHKEIINRVAQEKETANTDFRVLVKALGYTLSVVITGVEEDGFHYLEELAKRDNAAVKQIVRENLKKNRLIRLDEKRVREIQKIRIEHVDIKRKGK